jgi:hypothetical protein
LPTSGLLNFPQRCSFRPAQQPVHLRCFGAVAETRLLLLCFVPSLEADFGCSTARQIRLSAICRLVNFRTGATPGRRFQISTNRFSGQAAASASHSSLLAITCVPSAASPWSVETSVIAPSAVRWNGILYSPRGSARSPLHPSLCAGHKCKSLQQFAAGTFAKE